jgi:hypothetical protein
MHAMAGRSLTRKMDENDMVRRRCQEKERGRRVSDEAQGPNMERRLKRMPHQMEHWTHSGDLQGVIDVGNGWQVINSENG